MIRNNRHGAPYETLQAVEVGIMHLKKKGIEGVRVEVEGGFGIQTDEDEPKTEEKRPKRVPIGTRNVLTAPTRHGYKRRFVNIDEEKEGWDRIERFQGAGYSIVEGDVEIGNKRVAEASQIGKAVIRSVGGNVKGVLMEIKEDWFDEDQAEKQGRITEQEKSMTRTEQNPGEGMYGKIEIGPPG